MFTLDSLVIVLLVIALVIFIGEPFLRPALSSPPVQEGAEHRDALTLQRTILYTAIHDLDFDFQTGKVDQQDYQELRNQLEREAAAVLRQMDNVMPRPSSPSGLLSPAPAASAQCPQCQMLLQGGENFCPACGHALLSSQEA